MPPSTDHDFKIAENEDLAESSSRLYRVFTDRCEGRYLVKNVEPWHDGNMTWSYEAPEKQSPDFKLERGAIVLRLDGMIIDALWRGEIPVFYKERVVSVHRQELSLVWGHDLYVIQD